VLGNLVEEVFRIQGGHATAAGSRDRLPVDVVLDITAGEDGYWHVTDWNGKAKDSIYICFPILSENDPIWLEQTR